MRIMAAVIAAVLVAGTVAAENPRVKKKAWEFTDEERIASRVDRAQATARMAAAGAGAAISQHRLASTSARAQRPWTDVIVGKEHPELFLPTELFQTLAQDGFLSHDWREFYVKRIRSAGLPDDFWQRLRGLSEPFISDLERQQALLETAKHDPSKRTRGEAEIAGMYPTLCHDRAVALQRARATFGPALDRLLYEYVAGKMTMFTNDYADAGHLRAEVRGCQ